MTEADSMLKSYDLQLNRSSLFSWHVTDVVGLDRTKSISTESSSTLGLSLINCTAMRGTTGRTV